MTELYLENIMRKVSMMQDYRIKNEAYNIAFNTIGWWQGNLFRLASLRLHKQPRHQRKDVSVLPICTIQNKTKKLTANR